MRVRVVRSFVARLPGGTFRAVAGDEVELPEGGEGLLRAGFVVPAKAKAESAMRAPRENAMRPAPTPAGVPDAPLSALTVDELYALAQALDIEGRSGMNKDELIAALEAANDAKDEA